jgi:protoporphyrinogen IX oxidase
MQHYHQIFAAHLLAVIVFGGGVVMDALFLPALQRGEAARRGPELRRLMWWALCVTTPALCLVWGFGVTLALLAGWFAALWLQIKLVFVVFLTALHLYHLRALWRLQRPGAPNGVSYWLALPTIAALAVVVALAGAKPMTW